MSSQPSISRGSTTEPNTPEPLPIDEDDENNPSGDFARLIPRSRQARIGFHYVVEAMAKSPEKYVWHRKFIHIYKTMQELEPEHDEHSTSDELVPSLKSGEPALLHIHKGFWRLNMDIHPANRQIGWVMGRGRWKDLDSYAKRYTGGGVDILLAGPEEKSLHGRHARFLHNLESNAFKIFADHKVRVGEVHLRPTETTIFAKPRTALAFGLLEYDLAFTKFDQLVYKEQLAKLSRLIKYTGLNSTELIDPTPAETDYMIMDKYIIRSSFTQGSTCWMCTGVNKDTGASVAVKKIIAHSSSTLPHAKREIAAMQRLLSTQTPDSIAKLVDSIIVEPSKDSGATECYIISQPLINQNLGQLLVLNIGSFPASSRRQLLEQMLEGLAYLHAQGCMHRDIKPENILASASPPRAVIIDFGCATWETTSRNHLKGTIRYLAPEVIALKDSQKDPSLQQKLPDFGLSADIWSMGLTALELICGYRVRFENIGRRFYEEELMSGLGTADDWASCLIREMLQWDPRKRPYAKEAYQRCPGYNIRQDERILHHYSQKSELMRKINFELLLQVLKYNLVMCIYAT